jgi:hypothetical protein
MIRQVLDWSEIWAPVISLIAFSFSKSKKITGVSLVIVYIFVAIVLNTLADIIWLYKHSMPVWCQSNNILYNIHSIIRSVLFAIIFIKQLHTIKERIISWGLLCLYLVFAIINFTVIQSMMVFSSYLFAAEGILLILMSMQCLWYLFLNEKNDTLRHDPSFWIAIGVSIYEAANFFIFLFYSSLISTTYFAEYGWDIHNVFYIFFCLCLAKAIYESGR